MLKLKLWPPDVKNWLIGKDPVAGKDWRQEEMGATEDELVGWHHDVMAMSLSRLWELVMHRESWSAAVHEVAKSQIQLSNTKWTEYQFGCTSYDSSNSNLYTHTREKACISKHKLHF